MSTKRVRYFSGQFLRQEDFTEEQDYLRSMRSRHNKELHTFGIVEGLEVTPTGNPGEIEVENGWVIDHDGREIILAAPTKLTVDGDAPWYITCRFKERPTDEQPESVTGIEGHRRITEEADIEFVGAPLPTGVLVLAEITGTVASINVTDTRAFSGMKLPGDLIMQGDLTVTGTITGDIAVGIVQAADLVDDAVTSVKLSEADDTSGQSTNTGSGVKTNHIQDDAVTNTKLADGSVNAAKIAAGAVGNSELANDSVNADKIAADAVGSSELAASSVTAAAIAAGAVGNSELANNSVSTAKLDTQTQYSLLAGFVSFNNLGVILNSFGVTSVRRTRVGLYAIQWDATGESGPYVCQTFGKSHVSLIKIDANICTLQVTDLAGTPMDNSVHVFAAPSVKPRRP